jgi:competence protein ComEA
VNRSEDLTLSRQRTARVLPGFLEAMAEDDPAGLHVPGSSSPASDAVPAGWAELGADPPVADAGRRVPGWLQGGLIRRRLALLGLDPGRTGVRALAAVAVLVVLVAAVLTWRGRPVVEPVPVTPASSVDAAPASVGPSTAQIVVAVSGRVRRPGLVRLPVGARVADAIAAAGGVLPGTDLSLVNLARKLSDGELVLVGVTAAPWAGADASGSGADPSGVVNLNTATIDQLQNLPGVGPVLAQRIVDFRQRHGGFASVADLRQVTGIGDAKFAQLKNLVTV